MISFLPSSTQRLIRATAAMPTAEAVLLTMTRLACEIMQEVDGLDCIVASVSWFVSGNSVAVEVESASSAPSPVGALQLHAWRECSGQAAWKESTLDLASLSTLPCTVAVHVPGSKVNKFSAQGESVKALASGDVSSEVTHFTHVAVVMRMESLFSSVRLRSVQYHSLFTTDRRGHGMLLAAALDCCLSYAHAAFRLSTANDSAAIFFVKSATAKERVLSFISSIQLQEAVEVFTTVDLLDVVLLPRSVAGGLLGIEPRILAGRSALCSRRNINTDDKCSPHGFPCASHVLLPDSHFSYSVAKSFRSVAILVVVIHDMSVISSPESFRVAFSEALRSKTAATQSMLTVARNGAVLQLDPLVSCQAPCSAAGGDIPLPRTANLSFHRLSRLAHETAANAPYSSCAAARRGTRSATVVTSSVGIKRTPFRGAGTSAVIPRQDTTAVTSKMPIPLAHQATTAFKIRMVGNSDSERQQLHARHPASSSSFGSAWQWQKKFIVSVASSGALVCVDQHAIHERLRLEYFIATHEHYLTAEVLSCPIRIRDESVAVMAMRHKDALAQLGWRLGDHADALATVTTAPRISLEGFVYEHAGEDQFYTSLDELDAVASSTSSSLPSQLLPSPLLHTLVSRSCRGAIMFGAELSSSTCSRFLRCVHLVQQFNVCSHGRPSMCFVE